MIPEWAPNLHPMVVHFPIALLLAGIGADVMALVLRRWSWLRPAAVALYVAGGASAVLTYFTGTWAAEAASVPAAAEAVLSEHANLGWWTMWSFGVYALVRLGVYLWPKTRNRLDLQALLLLIVLGGGYLLYETGDHGAELVFRYGVGVQNVEETPAPAEPGLTIGADGWRTVRAVGDGTHFRGYVDGTMIVHGHGDAASPGVAGLRLDGTGTVVLRRLSGSTL